MNKKIFSVYDKKAGIYAAPFVSINKNTAVRDFGNAVNDPSTQLHKNPEDFVLVLIGEFDDETAVIHVSEVDTVCNAFQLVEE